MCASVQKCFMCKSVSRCEKCVQVCKSVLMGKSVSRFAKVCVSVQKCANVC